MFKKFLEKMGWLSRKKLMLFVLVFSLSLLGIAIFQITTNNNRLNEEYKKQETFITQKETFEQLELFVRTAEDDLRGYTLTGDERFINNFDATIDSIVITVRQLQSLMLLPQDPKDALWLIKLDTLVLRKISFMREVLTLAEVSRPGAAALIANGVGVRTTDSISTISDSLIQSYMLQLDLSKARFSQVKSEISKIIWFSIVFSFLLILLVFYILFCEISRTKRASDQLQLEKEHFHCIVNCMSEGLITTGKNGDIIFMNPAAEKMTGWQYYEAKSRPLEEVYNVVNEETGKPFKNIVSRVLEHGKCFQMENNTILKTKYSNDLTIRNSGSPLFNLHGEFNGSVLVFNDVTQRKIEGNKIKESEEKYRLLIEQAADGIFIVDINGSFLETNSMGCKMLGYTKEELLNMNLVAITPEEYTGKLSVNLTRLFDGATVLVERKFTRKDKSEFYCEFSAKLTASGDVQAIVRDITERKIAENKFYTTSNDLAKAVTDLNKILDSSSDVICTINTDGEFVNVSAASQQVWGYKPDELIGTKFINLVCPEDFDKTLKAAESITNKVQVSLFENCYVHKCGKKVSMLWSVNWDEKDQLMFCIAKDITEKKILEKTLETERNQFYDMFTNAPSAIGMLKGSDHIFEVANPLYLESTGKKDVIGKSVAEVFPEVIEQGFVSMLDNVYRTGETFIGTEALVKVDKEGTGEMTEFYMNFIYQAYRNAEGIIEGVFFFINDVTEQILTRKAIEKSEKFFKGVLDSSADMITLIDSVGKTIYTSPAVSKKFGYTLDECLELNMTDVVHPDDASIMQAFVMEVIINPEIPLESPIVRNRKKDGSYIWVEGTLTNFLDTEGINAIVANFRDVTERRKIDKEIIFKANLLNTIGQAAIATDLNGMVNYWNRAAENIYGWTKEEALGKNIMDLTTSEATNEQGFQIMEELKKGHTWSGEFRVRKKDGANFPAMVSNSPIYDEQNQLSGIIGISTDISEKKKLKELLEKSNRMARIGSWEIDVVNNTVFWSDITKEIREVPLDFIPQLNKGISYFKEGFSQDTITQRVKDCIEKGMPWDDELEIITHKGNNKWVRTIGEGEFVDGKCIRMYGSFQDINARKRAEREVMESELLNRSILSSITSPIAVVDSDGNLITVNKSWNDFSKDNGEARLSRTGKGSNYFAVCRQAALAGDKTAVAVLKGIKKVLSKELPFFEMEYPCNSPSEQRWFLLRVTSFVGDVPKVVIIHTDISERKNLELQRQKALERYDTLSKATSDTIWDQDLVNNTILYNDGISKVMGYQKWDVKNVSEWWKQNIHPDDLDIVLTTLESIIENEAQTFELEYRFRCADGSYKDIFDRAFVIYDEQGKATRMIGAMQDVTHKKGEEIRVAKAIVEAQEGERCQLGMELHDNINQLLTASLLYLSLAETHKNKDDFPEMIHTCKNHITEAIQETRKLSHQLAPVSYEHISLKKVFELLIANMNTQDRFAVDFQFGDFDVDAISQSIQITLYRILQEQMNNIIKYADANRVEVIVRIIDNNVTLIITDNGKGFDINAVKTGIGLENIKRRAALYSGKFICSSSPGQGCKILVTIPLKDGI